MARALIGFVVLTCGLLMPATVHARPIALAWDASTDDVSGRCEGSDGDALTYTANGLPPGLNIDAATGVISGTLSPTSAGSYTVTVRASDGSLARSRTFVWTVTHTD